MFLPYDTTLMQHPAVRHRLRPCGNRQTRCRSKAIIGSREIFLLLIRRNRQGQRA